MFTDPVDTILCQLTLEGRNLLARMKFGTECLFTVDGWQMGRGGYDATNPVKITPIVDNTNQSVGYIEVISNSNWKAGDQIVLNGVSFIKDTHWVVGGTAEETADNILKAVNDSKDPGIYRLILADIDPLEPAKLRFTSIVYGNVLTGKDFNLLPAAINVSNDEITLVNHDLVNYMECEFATTGTLPNGVLTGAKYYIEVIDKDTFKLSTTLNTPNALNITTQGTGIHSILPTANLYPINYLEVPGASSFEVTPMSLAISNALIDAAYPVPPTLGSFLLPDGRIERPTDSSLSFVLRIPDGAVGMNAYGEVGLWATIIQSTHPMEIGRKVLFAHGHFPIFAKTDRSLWTFRVVVTL